MELKQLIPLSILLFGCQPEQWNDCMTSTGSMSTQERNVGDFNTIDVGDRVDLVLDQRSSGSVSVEAGANLLGQITTEVSDGTLKVRNEMRCNWVRSFKPRIVVHVPIDQVAKLVLRGTGNVSCTDSLIRDRFELEQWGAQGSASLLLGVTSCSIALHTGAGDVVLRGRCHSTADLFSGIQGPIDASGMIARFVNVNNNGIADMRCWVTEQLHVQINDVGDVYYRGRSSRVCGTISPGSGSLMHATDPIPHPRAVRHG
ncbi:MAG: DUF2807 domain-containing protein [Flavobacteriales bacterium]|nr:DUF2807 domain-containing protein [Flavobacteriales bacterium]